MASVIKVNTIKDLGGNTIVSSNGSGTISGLPASAISSGTVATARLGSGTASSSTFLAGDSSYKTVSGTTINNNANNKVITGSASANTLEGETNFIYNGTIVGAGADGENADLGSGIHIKKADSGASALADANALVIESDADTGLSILQHTGGNGTIAFGDSGDNNIGMIQYYHGTANAMVFHTNGAERMRILSDGKVGIGKTSSLRGFDVQIPSVNNYMAEFKNNTNDRPHGLYMEFSQATPNRDDEKFLYCGDQSAARLTINANGNVKNANNSYGAISDRRLKENITDANSQWNDIKKIKFKNFNLINETTTQLGVIAQDLETDSMNGLVSNSPADKHQIGINSEFGTLHTKQVLYTSDDEEVKNEKVQIGDVKNEIGDVKENLEKVKGVKYSVLLLKSAKALQEAMEKIETLEAKVTALENA